MNARDLAPDQKKKLIGGITERIRYLQTVYDRMNKCGWYNVDQTRLAIEAAITSLRIAVISIDEAGKPPRVKTAAEEYWAREEAKAKASSPR